MASKRRGKPTATSKQREKQRDQESPAVPAQLQQAILDSFRHAFGLSQDANLKSVIQEVKGHLFRRDFSTAFGKPEYLQAYAIRWSASRALAYAQVFVSLQSRH